MRETTVTCTERRKDSEPGKHPPAPTGCPWGPVGPVSADTDTFPTKSRKRLWQGVDYRQRKAQLI